MTRRRDWPVTTVLVVCIAGALLFLALLGPARHLMCTTHANSLSYCPGFNAQKEPAR